MHRFSLRHVMISKRCLFTARALPVTRTQFYNALKQSWGDSTGETLGSSSIIGLAVSGGVDSMALATLCSLDTSWLGNVVAFVVDHAARAKSSDEADHIVDHLQRQLCINAQKLTLRWPGGTVPLELQNFETVARKLRFRALGAACVDLKISNLLLGHHQDDQAETVLMRLANGSPTYGLRGILPSHSIPECEGLYGVHESGANRMSDACQAQSPRQTGGPEPAAGGVRVLRPLLPFSKEQLIATCEEHGVKWIEDHTNADPGLTLRNAVRHIFKSSALPEAISKPALLEISHHATMEQVAIERDAERLMTKSIIGLDTYTGSLTVTVPWDACDKMDMGPEPERKQHRLAAVAYARRLMMMVAPSQTIHLDQAATAARALFSPVPSLWSEETRTLGQPADEVVSCGSVLIQRLYSRSWRLTRAKPHVNASDDNTILIEKLADAQDFVLFDCRYWIKLKCDEIRVPLVIRLLREDDVPRIRAHLRKSDKRMLQRVELLWSGPPHYLVAQKYRLRKKERLRAGLPVIAVADDSPETADDAGRPKTAPRSGLILGPGSPIALPSLGVNFDKLFEGDWEWLRSLQYDVRYRMTDYWKPRYIKSDFVNG